MRHPALFLLLLLLSLVPATGAAQSSGYGGECLTNVDNATVLVPTSADLSLSNDAVLEPEDTVAVRNSNGDCVGYGVWEGNGTSLTIAAAGPSATDQLKSGYEQGDSLSFEVFDASQQETIAVGRSVEYAACDSIAIATCTDEGTYVDGALLVIASLNPLQRFERSIAGTDGTGNDRGWRLLASPAQASRTELEDDLDFDTASRDLTYSWNGSQWAALSSSDSLRRGKGFILFLDDDSNPVNSEGLTLDVPTTGAKRSVSVSTDLDPSHRFHLLGNPYGAAFDLSKLQGPNGETLGSSGFQAAVMVWDPVGKRWTTITEDPNSTDDKIAAWQGFFVRRSERGQGASSVTFNSSGKLQEDGTLIGSKSRAKLAATRRATVDLELTVTDESDTVATNEATVLFDERATADWDPYEASQLPPPHSEPYVTLSSPMQHRGEVTRRLQASRGYPTDPTEITVPLSVRSVEVEGTATLHWPAPARQAVPEDWAVELEDRATGERIDLHQNDYTFELDVGDGSLSSPDEARFRLHVSPFSGTVSLAQFEAAPSNDQSVRLTWRTTREAKNKGFYVQRKSLGESARAQDGTDWQRLDFVEGTGTGHTYRFTDKELPFAADSVRYRLRQVSTTGSEYISAERVVTRTTPSTLALEAPFPNPARQRTTLRFAVPAATDAEVTLYDVLGRRVATLADGQLEEGRHERQVTTGRLGAGTYFVRLRAEGQTHTRKLTVVH